MPEGESAKSFAVVPAAQADVELAKGVLLAGARNEITAEAMAYLNRAAALAPENPVVWQALGEAALMNREQESAGRYFARAAELGSRSYYVYYGLGVTRLQNNHAVGGYYDPSESAKAAANFRRAIELNPRFVPSYEGLAGLLSALEKLDPGDRAKLEHARILAPESAIIEVGLAVLDFKSGRRDAARERLAAVTASTDGKYREARRLAESLLLEDEWTQFSGQVETLFRDRHYAEVVRLIDEAQPRFTDSRYRATLAANRRTAESSRRISEAVELANSGRTAEARTALTQLLEESTDTTTKSEAQRLLREIDAGKDSRR